MVVDDSMMMRDIIKKAFNKLGKPVNFLEAEDGERAYSILEENQVALIIMNWNMPKLNGIDVLKKVRASEAYKDIPVVMLTSEAAKSNLDEAMKAGATAYLTKPIKEDIFMETFSKIDF